MEGDHEQAVFRPAGSFAKKFNFQWIYDIFQYVCVCVGLKSVYSIHIYCIQISDNTQAK